MSSAVSSWCRSNFHFYFCCFRFTRNIYRENIIITIFICVIIIHAFQKLIEFLLRNSEAGQRFVWMFNAHLQHHINKGVRRLFLMLVKVYTLHPSASFYHLQFTRCSRCSRLLTPVPIHQSPASVANAVLSRIICIKFYSKTIFLGRLRRRPT